MCVCVIFYLHFLIFIRGRVNSMAIHPTGKIALSVGIDRACIVWNLMTGRRASVNKVGRGMLILNTIQQYVCGVFTLLLLLL